MAHGAREKWMHEARRYSLHIWCYEDLIEDHMDTTLAAFDAGQDVYEFVEQLGDDYGLMRADQDWGINSGRRFDRKIVKLENADD